jgi:hypothetical protein
VTPAGVARSSSGVPWLRNSVPWYAAGMKPAVQFEALPIGPPRGSVITT